jgi:hypothetical protein
VVVVSAKLNENAPVVTVASTVSKPAAPPPLTPNPVGTKSFKTGVKVITPLSLAPVESQTFVALTVVNPVGIVSILYKS